MKKNARMLGLWNRSQAKFTPFLTVYTSAHSVPNIANFCKGQVPAHTTQNVVIIVT